MKENIITILFSVFLAFSAWQDMRKKEVKIWVYCLFGCAAVLRFLAAGGTAEFWSVAAGILPGLFLLIVGRLTGGAVGSGDGLFFAIGGVLLGITMCVQLFLYGMMLCGLGSAVFYVYEWRKGKNIGKETVPFLPFLVPVWIWMAVC